MVSRKNLNFKYALVSVYNKNKLGFLCKNLKKYNYKFLSTGSTCKKIRDLGFQCVDIEQITKFKEIFDGRVKTLNPKIFGTLLYKRNNIKHINEFKKLNMPNIDIVIVNLYPFEKYIKSNDMDKIIDMIDIGGSSLLRASSKNYNYINAISDVSDYQKLVNNLKKNNGITDLNFRKRMAAKSFGTTYEYDKLIYNWFINKKVKKNNILKYGENPNQNSFIEKVHNKSIFKHQLSGKKIISKDQPVSGPMEFNTNIKKISEITGWEPQFNIQQGLKKTFNIMKSYYSK